MNTKEIAEQERELQFVEFNNEIAWELGSRFAVHAMEENLPIAISIYFNSQLLFHFAMKGTSVDNDQWIKRKNRIVNHFGHSSYYIGKLLKERNTSLENAFFLDSMMYSPFGGALPITIRNVGVVGTITVSGLTEEEDHQLVVRVVKEFLQSYDSKLRSEFHD
jgi:uncharacterized protein (UPF0303 family)